MRNVSTGGERKSLLFVIPHSNKNKFSRPQENTAEMTPLQYFKLFWDDNILEHIAQHTNLYSVQHTGKSIKTNATDFRCSLVSK